ncbi:MAG TPA: hypothetical protein VGV67_10925 [Solirubrobacteraceae bacterium]|nr:hypothetical protein [Solirubrobacteraceae bacterium]
MTAEQLTTLGLEGLDAGFVPVQLLMRDGKLFSGPLTYVCDDYAILGGRGFMLEEIAYAELLTGDDPQRGRPRPRITRRPL